MSNGTATILFADDEPWLNEALRLSLEAQGFKCISVTNMTEAVRILEAESVKVLVTDIMMPSGEDFPDVDPSSAGFSLVRLAQRKFPEVSLICLSVIGDPRKIAELKRQRVLYLRKGETTLETAIKLISSKATGRISFY